MSHLQYSAYTFEGVVLSARAWPLKVVKPSRIDNPKKPAQMKNPKATAACEHWQKVMPWHSGTPMKAAMAIEPENQKIVVMTRMTNATRAW
ncbi:hypothetical protein CCMA1212_005210 [Trichoderma ghanense]|uniref:Uncharacterized protein n=1 Tax=Trichoderma ghanense TaxID=65468 RepID=A0ABY2H3J1_9HYPO